MKSTKIKQVVKKQYGKIAAQSGSCCSCGSDCAGEADAISKYLGYSEKDIKAFADANLGLGCGTPTGLGKIKKGETVLDLGSGAGFDCFLAAKMTGEQGKVIGVDMTPQMIKRAKANAKKYGFKNVEFKLGDIEKLPLKKDSVDVIISNCVINLAPDKVKVFKEASRVLKTGGRMYVSDIVLLKELTEEQREDEYLVTGCVGGALLKNDYLDAIKSAGLSAKILSEDKKISKAQYEGLPVESLKLQIKKNKL